MNFGMMFYILALAWYSSFALALSSLSNGLNAMVSNKKNHIHADDTQLFIRYDIEVCFSLLNVQAAPCKY